MIRVVSILFVFVLVVVAVFSPLIVSSVRLVQETRTCQQKFNEVQTFFADSQSLITTDQWQSWQSRTQKCTTAFYRWDTTYSAYLRYIPFLDDMMTRVYPQWRPFLHTVRTYLPLVSEFMQEYPNIAGIDATSDNGKTNERRYILAFENNTELRPTGGFLGSYAYVVFRNGKIAEFTVDDIYNPDGQLQGYVEPPAPIKNYLFQAGGWHLRDSNWNPNFPEAAQTMAWFFEHGGYQQIDGIGVITLSTVQDALKIIGDVYLPDYSQTVSADTLYAFAQSQTEQQFFPGASNKRDVLGALSRAVLRKLGDLSIEQRIQLTEVFFHRLKTKDILLWTRDPLLQQVIEKHGWDGAIRQEACTTVRCRADLLYIVEANVGINKTNCCIDRTAHLDLWFNDDETATSSVQLNYENHNPVTPQPPKFYGGGYRNYLRIIKNPDMTLEGIAMNNSLLSPKTIDVESDPKLNIQSYGFISDVGGGDKGDVTALFSHQKRLDYASPQSYELTILKQPGLETNEYFLTIHLPKHVSVSLGSSAGLSVLQKSSNTMELHGTIESDQKI